MSKAQYYNDNYEWLMRWIESCQNIEQLHVTYQGIVNFRHILVKDNEWGTLTKDKIDEAEGELMCAWDCKKSMIEINV